MGSLSESADVKFVQFAQKYTTLQEAFNEEERFNRTLPTGLRYLEMAIDLMAQQNTTMLPGREAFKLHDTYGFPLDLTQKILAERNLDVNVEEYEEARREQQERLRVATHSESGRGKWNLGS